MEKRLIDRIRKQIRRRVRNLGGTAERGSVSVLVGMSGGIDSAVTLGLLKEAGIPTRALFILMFDSPQTENALESAREVCCRFRTPIVVQDQREVFQQIVVDYFTASYMAGRTPNPCVICNREIKFRAMLARAAELGTDFISTGHYARIAVTSQNRAFLLRARSRRKDQSYFIHRMELPWLMHTIFPLAELEKEQVHQLAAHWGLTHLVQPESQEVCFLKNGLGDNYRNFLSMVMPEPEMPGQVVDSTGKIFGSHKGLFNYTIGQRRGLNLPDSTPWYVIGMEPENNRLVIGKEQELYSSEMKVSKLHLLVPYNPAIFSVCQVKIRYQSRPVECSVEMGTDSPGQARVIFKEPQRAITPGQFAVFYKGPLVLGGGEICR